MTLCKNQICKLVSQRNGTLDIAKFLRIQSCRKRLMVHTWMARPCSPPPPPSPPPTPPLSSTGPPPPGSPGSSGPECGKDSLHTFPPLRWIQKGCGFGGGDRCSGNIYPSHGSPSGLTHVGVEMQGHSGNVQIIPNCAESTIEQLSVGFERRFESFYIKRHIICKERQK